MERTMDLYGVGGTELELKHCPFCGGKAEFFFRYGNGEKGVGVGCLDCKATGMVYEISFDYSAKWKAAEAWNRRADSGVSTLRYVVE